MVRTRLLFKVRDTVITLLIVALVAIVLILPSFNPGMAVYMTIIVVGMSLALQKYLANFVGHFVIRWSGIFDIGDRIRIGAVKGDVKRIGMFHIVIDEVGDDDKMGGELTGKITSVPNLLVLDQAVQNYSRDFSVEDEMITCGYIFDEIRIPLKPESNVRKARAILVELLHEQNSTFIKEASKIFVKGLPNYLREMENGPKVSSHIDKDHIWITGRFITPIRTKNEVKTKIGEEFIERIQNDSSIKIC